LARVTPHSVKVDESTSDYRLKEFDGSKRLSWRENSGHMFFVSQLAISEERSTFLVPFWALQARLSAQGVAWYEAAQDRARWRDMVAKATWDNRDDNAATATGDVGADG
jgi:hypothetical protein